MLKALRPIFKALDMLIDNTPVYEHHYVVNYVWINANKSKPENSLCSVPLKNLDQAYENARKYPKAKFLIWIDKDMIDPLSDFFVLSHGYLTAPDNVEFRNLRDIKEINELGIFSEQCQLPGEDDGFKRMGVNLYGRTDVARLLVLQHNLREEPESFQLYADFDIQDVKLNSMCMHKALSTDGIFLGTPYGRYFVENGYMCFGAGEGQSYLSNYLIPETTNRVTKYNDNGWTTLCATFEYNSCKFTLDKFDLIGARQESSGYVLPDNKEYKEWGLN